MKYKKFELKACQLNQKCRHYTNAPNYVKNDIQVQPKKEKKKQRTKQITVCFSPYNRKSISFISNGSEEQRNSI